MIDSSPIYGSSQDTIGYDLKKLYAVDKVSAADKVWTYSGGAAQSDLALVVSSLLPPAFVLDVSEPLADGGRLGLHFIWFIHAGNQNGLSVLLLSRNVLITQRRRQGGYGAKDQ
jgi:hypothetical protein